MAHEHRRITESIDVASVGGQVQINTAILSRQSEDYVTTTIIVEPEIARDIAHALVAMAADAVANANAAHEPVA
jgi:hypothetical protein